MNVLPRFCFLATLALCMGRVTAAPPDSALPVLAVLDPVDLSQVKTLPQPGQVLRSAAGRAARFRVISSLETAQKLLDFDWNAGKPCHDFQCAFDAGNVLMADYVLFGTLTPFQEVHAFTFNVLNTRTGKVVHSDVGQAPRNLRDPGDGHLHARLGDFAARLSPTAFQNPSRASRGFMAIIDLSRESPESRAVAERIGARIHSIHTHDLIGQLELRELLSAMEIPLPSLAATDSGLIGLGSRLNVAYLVKSDLSRESGGLRLELALFDIAGKRKVRSWSARSSGGFQEILRTETRFSRTLEEVTGSGWDGAEGKTARGARGRWLRGLGTVAGIAATGALGALAYAMHEEADQAYRHAESSLSPQSGRMWKRRTEERDQGTLVLGSLAALTLGATITLWTF